MYWYLEVLKRFSDFRGRSRRKELWMFILINFLIVLGIAILENMLGLGGDGWGYGPLSALYLLFVLVPSIALWVRRVHDIGMSGLWVLIFFIPLVNLIALLYFGLKDGDPGPNRFGPSPKGELQPPEEAPQAPQAPPG